jgi:hypothetical protein
VYRTCTVFDTEIRLVDRTWTSFEFSCQEKSHVMGRVPDAFRPSGLIFLLESKKASCIRSVPAFGPNLCVGVEKVGHEVSSTGRGSIFLISLHISRVAQPLAPFFGLHCIHSPIIVVDQHPAHQIHHKKTSLLPSSHSNRAVYYLLHGIQQVTTTSMPDNIAFVCLAVC